MMKKRQMIDFINKHSSFGSIIGACQSSPGQYSVKFLRSSTKLEFDDDFSDWCYAKIDGDNRPLVYAKVGVIHHRKFDRDLGFVFILSNEETIEFIQGFLVQNIRNRLHLTQMID